MLKTLKLLLPALIPSWRFFDAIAPSPRIEYSVLKTSRDRAANWQEFRPRPKHLPVSGMLKRLFWNPSWNETLFLVSCAERLMDDGAERSAQEIAQRIKAALRKAEAKERQAPYVQFRLVFVSRQNAELQKYVTFTSRVYPFFGNAIS